MEMSKLRGFRLGRRLVKLFRRTPRPKRTHVQSRHDPTRSPIARICSLARRFGLGHDGGGTAEVPKGHLAVYVGESSGDAKRVTVPVIYFNHPLFGELLAESERVYGFDHSGGIMIPCRISEFEKIKTRIANWDRCKSRQYVRTWFRF